MEGIEKIKELVSRYVDHEVTPEERVLVEEYIRTSEEIRAYYNEMLKLNALLKECPLEETSSDWEQKVVASLQKEGLKGASSMKRTHPLVRVGVGGSLLVTLLIALLSLRMYTERGIQGKLKETVHAAYTPAPLKNQAGPQQYEPYYLQSNVRGRQGTVSHELAMDTSGSWFAASLGQGVYTGMIGVPTEKWRSNADFNTEAYDRIYENRFLEVKENPLSTFSIDVDTASYSNVRRFLNHGHLPPEDAVRIEEMVNYFTYDYPQPQGDDPFSITIDGAVCPWNPAHDIVRVGIKGRTYTSEALPASNLVFLIDVSGSMDHPDKLPLLQSAFGVLTNRLSDRERVAIVVYAGNAGKVLDSTPGNKKSDILAAVSELRAGGSTAGGEGIRLAYQIARENYIEGGNNRVILATDGDFNVGVSSDAELVRMIEAERTHGIFLTVLGFGTGNYKDSKMEQLADTGNGNYYYIDTRREAEKVLGHELGSTIFTIAKDVKIQIEFNPAQVKAYRLIGYENRMLAKEDFNDDKKDAGELGAGHTVTALYELVPADSDETFTAVDELSYQKTAVVQSSDLMTVKLRYKKPDEDVSMLLQRSIAKDQLSGVQPSGDLLFASSVAEFGMLLRNSEQSSASSYEQVLAAAKMSQGADEYGYRAEFIELVGKAKGLDTRDVSGGDSGIQFK